MLLEDWIIGDLACLIRLPAVFLRFSSVLRTNEYLLVLFSCCLMLSSVILLQGNFHVASVYAGNESIQLKGPEIIVELNNLLRLLTLCMLFSKKTFPVFLESAGYSEEEVLLQKPKAGVGHSLHCLCF